MIALLLLKKKPMKQEENLKNYGIKGGNRYEQDIYINSVYILDYMVVYVSADLDYEAEVMGVHICVLSVLLEKEKGGNNE